MSMLSRAVKSNKSDDQQFSHGGLRLMDTKTLDSLICMLHYMWHDAEEAWGYLQRLEVGCEIEGVGYHLYVVARWAIRERNAEVNIDLEEFENERNAAIVSERGFG